MTRQDTYIVSIIAAATAIICAVLLSNALRPAEVAPNNVSRWTIHNQYNGGWNIFDSATGVFCSVPDGNDPSKTEVNCSSKPPTVY